MQHADFLVEIQTEELPPKNLFKIGEDFLKEISIRLQKSKLSFGETKFFVTPRRLAVHIKKLDATQPTTTIGRKGPTVKAAFDAQGNPTQACLGFARSMGVTPKELIILDTPQGQWVSYNQIVQGQTIQSILPNLILEALNALSFKKMRWGFHTQAFIRPIHSIVLLYGKETIKTELFNCLSGRLTTGHRFLSPKLFSIYSPYTYEKKLEKHFVIADFFKRREVIQKNILTLAKSIHAKPFVSSELLDEVTGLVEWPVVLLGSFDATFLKIPQEILISAMQDHQRYFALMNSKKELLPHFILISNISSRDPKSIIIGNERVLRARLADANFFFENDKKIKLVDRFEKLKYIVFQKKLGSLADKTHRLIQLTKWTAKQLKLNLIEAKRAAYLSKCDLTSNVVNEFPTLQGIMGGYYARHDGESLPVSHAIAEQYLPAFSGDQLPSSFLGCALALADKLDFLVGIFCLHGPPTGDRDPYGLRRAATGILRILIEREIELDLKEFIHLTVKNYKTDIVSSKKEQAILQFVFDRLKPWYQEKNISSDVFNAVNVLQLTIPYDLHQRIQAVQAFLCLPEANALSVANKRVSNILSRIKMDFSNKKINAALLKNETEKKLARLLKEKANIVAQLSKQKNYTQILRELASLRSPIDDFFKDVLVMVDDLTLRQNRLCLLQALRDLFLHVADIAYLPGSI